MDRVSHMWDRLSGSLMLYVENYILQKQIDSADYALNKRKITLFPSYNVDYDISKEIIDYINQTLEEEDLKNIWYLQIAACKNINELPLQLQKLIIQFLPRFFSEFPEYKNENCLIIK